MIVWSAPLLTVTCETGERVFVRKHTVSFMDEGFERQSHEVTDVYTCTWPGSQCLHLPCARAPAVITLDARLHYRLGTLLCGTVSLADGTSCLSGFMTIRPSKARQHVCLASEAGDVIVQELKKPLLIALARLVAFDDGVVIETLRSSLGCEFVRVRGCGRLFLA